MCAFIMCSNSLPVIIIESWSLVITTFPLSVFLIAFLTGTSSIICFEAVSKPSLLISEILRQHAYAQYSGTLGLNGYEAEAWGGRSASKHAECVHLPSASTVQHILYSFKFVKSNRLYNVRVSFWYITSMGEYTALASSEPAFKLLSAKTNPSQQKFPSSVFSPKSPP